MKKPRMKVFTNPATLQKWSRERRRAMDTIALVPTMGFLHEGHLSLIREARFRGVAQIVVSIFVNPVQFGPNEDYDKYPRDLEADIEKCRAAGATAVFCPSPKEMYMPDHSVFINEELLSKGLCGARRPGHFRGVCTVVAKLFNLVHPHIAIFGQKDYQQAQIIKRMVRDLNFDVRVIVAPIVREESGLALSSRNTYLSEVEREKALAISRSLYTLKSTKAIENALTKAGLKVDYVECVDAETLEPRKRMVPGTCVLVAAYCGKTRLIDNRLI